ncbi:hypothetical protein [Kingella sp. (in: b-proteobacteria)]|nr:hypothetical protein [Kingella sp. (in: b-proteobacteria)]MDO4657656.1 hypothetical protein [Kingella sp. (in: b-proteobacteria)]
MLKIQAWGWMDFRLPTGNHSRQPENDLGLLMILARDFVHGFY